MYLAQRQVTTQHYRESKLGHLHPYTRQKTVVDFRCDCCSEKFTRYKGDISPTRLNNNVYHVCNKCDAKKFAQAKGVESRKVWDMPVSSLKTIDQL
jgi:hypothetical protein